MSNSSSSTATKQGYECPKCKNNYSTAYSMYRHMRKVHNCDVNRCVSLYCPIENCNQSYDRYNALDTHLTHGHYADIRKETFNFSDLTDFEAWLRDITSSSKTKYIKRSCNNSYRYYRCHRSGLPKTSTEKITSMKSSVKIGRHCPSRIIAKITDTNVQVEFVPTHIGHDCEIAKIPLSEKKRLDIACRLANSSSNAANANATNSVIVSDAQQQQVQQFENQILSQNHDQTHLQAPRANLQSQLASGGNNTANRSGNAVRVASNTEATTSNILQSESSLVVTLAPMKSVGAPDQRQQQLGQPIQHHSHLIQSQLTVPQPQIATTNDMNLGPTTPSRQDLTNKFGLLMSSIRSDKHASIVKAQLDLCFALISD